MLKEIGTRFRVTLHLGRAGPPKLDRTEDAIVRLLRDDRGYLTSEIAHAIDLSPRATRTRLLRLVGRGLVREVGTSPQDPKRRYFLSR
jgi:predicted ArsR family transcriptional regulator